MDIILVVADGRNLTIAAEPGKRLMEVIRDSGNAIRAECGGVCACATCHVYVDPEWITRLPKASDNEAALLEVAEEVTEFSRLSCQIKLSEEYDGLKVKLAPGS